MTVKVLVVFCIGLALVTTLFGALRDMAAENRKRVVEVTCKLADKARRVELNGVGSSSHHNHSQHGPSRPLLETL